MNRTLHERLDMALAETLVSTRACNCMLTAKLVYIGDLVQHRASDLLQIRNANIGTLSEIERVLDLLGLQLGMDTEGWQHPTE